MAGDSETELLQSKNKSFWEGRQAQRQRLRINKFGRRRWGRFWNARVLNVNVITTIEVAITASHTRPWLVSGWGRQYQRPSIGSGNLDMRPSPWLYRLRVHRRDRFADERVRR